MRERINAAPAALAFSLLLALNQGANLATAAESPSAEFIVVFEDKVSRTASNKIITNAGFLRWNCDDKPFGQCGCGEAGEPFELEQADLRFWA